VIRSEGVFEAEELRASLRHSGARVSKATVYRTLRLLQEAGIVQRVLFEENEPRYLFAYGSAPNDLLIRLDTRSVEAIDAPELSALCDRLCRDRGLEPRGYRFQVFAVARARGPRRVGTASAD
jgi:Fur family ferric uptake transcriptional regulator